MSQPHLAITTTLPNQGALAYAEVTALQISTNGSLGIGLCAADGSPPLTQLVSDNGSAMPPLTAGQRVGIAYNQNTGNAWARINGGAWLGGGDPVAGTSPTATGISGPQYVSCAVGEFSSSSQVVLAAMLAAFVDAVPSGYSSWSSQ